jgi:hypothetical protein
MNALYNWTNDEIMVTERMKDIQREVDQINLLHTSGLAGSSLWERLAVTLGNALIHLGQRLQRKHTHPHQSYRPTGSRYAA